ncbi:MAG: FAD-dependent oxidoreductase [Burkholderiaceae bacterium]
MPIDPHPSRIAIVGGGVAGCAAAILLRAQGHEVTLFEAVADPRPVGAGLLLQPTGQAILRRLGLLDEVLAHGAPVQRLFGDNARGRTVLDLDYGRFAPGCFGLGIQRGTLIGLLWRRMLAAGTTVRLATSVEGFAQDDAGVSLAGAGGVELGRFDALILANGSFSTLRAGMQVQQAQAPSHGMSPQLGQGANMALIDAWVLAHCVRTARTPHGVAWNDAFAGWSDERRPHLRFYQRSSVALTPLFQSHGRVAPLLRDLFFGLPGRWSWVHQHSVAALAGLKTGWLSGRIDLARYDPPAAAPP